MTIYESNEQDYYRILGVLRSANLAEITAAYRALARYCHPDAGATDAESLARFKQVSAAYEVLSDEEKRRAYDWQWRPNLHVSPSSGSAASTASFCYPCTPGLAGPTPRSNDIEVELPITPEEALCGGPCDFTLKIARVCGPCSGRGRIAADPCAVCQGEGRTYEEHHLQLMLPRRAKGGTVIRFPRRGKRSKNSVGDLVVRLRVQPCWKAPQP